MNLFKSNGWCSVHQSFSWTVMVASVHSGKIILEAQILAHTTTDKCVPVCADLQAAHGSTWSFV